jgi:hypothetical protein
LSLHRRKKALRIDEINGAGPLFPSEINGARSANFTHESVNYVDPIIKHIRVVLGIFIQVLREKAWTY